MALYRPTLVLFKEVCITVPEEQFIHLNGSFLFGARPESYSMNLKVQKERTKKCVLQ